MKMVKLTGGGYGSSKVIHDRKGKVEPKPRAVNVATNAQQGAAVAFKKAPLVSGPGYTGGKVGSTGIANARQGYSGPGPGGGNRTIYKSGSQSPTPPAKELPKGRDILGAYGPERSKGGG
jgi:hypothetical protein